MPEQFQNTALRARRLSLRRDGGTILRRLNLDVARGEIVALLGTNGAGKTTLLHCLAGLLRPTEGMVQWLGEARPSAAAKKCLGFLGHESGLYSYLTALENLVFACRMHGLEKPREKAAEFLDLVGAAAHGNVPAGRLSRGTRQRIAIARAVIHDPPIFLLDEPCTSLDATGRLWLEEYLRHKRQQGCAIVITSHELDRCQRFADRVLNLKDGILWPTEASEPNLHFQRVAVGGRLSCG